jgi:hypothetical protein
MGLAVLAAGCGLSGLGQIAGENQPPAEVLLSSTELAYGEQPPNGQVVREIDDPQTGDRWLLVRDPGHSGGPGRMVLAVAGLAESRQTGTGDASSAASSPASFSTGRQSSLPVIHTADRLIVQEDTALVVARLEAVALGPALSGSSLKVRLLIGGSVVRAVALGPGRAVFAPETEARP